MSVQVSEAGATREAPGGWTLLWALSLAQLVSWGAVYYTFSLYVVPMEAALGWDRSAMNGALSLGLLTAGVCAYPVGAWIDRRGGRLVMSLGSLLAVLLLVAWSQVESLLGFYLIWIGLGAALAATLYEPAFAVLTRRFPQSYRMRITALTLVGGFASTVFIPLTQFFIAELGWRDSLLALAACVALLALPVHAMLLRDGAPHGGDVAGTALEAARVSRDALRRALPHPVFLGLAVCFFFYFGTMTALVFHLIPLATERGMASEIIVAAYATIGPAQVAGRIVLLSFGNRFSTPVVGRTVVLMFPAAILLLTLSHSVLALFAFTILYGAANGIMTIIRGTAVPDLMWKEGYGAINGVLTLPARAAQALAPFAAAVLWVVAGGYGSVLWTLLALSLLGAAGFWFAAGAAARRRP